MTNHLRELERASTAVASAANPELAASAAVGAPGRQGGDGDTYVIENVDARGAEDPRAVRRSAKRGISDALRSANARR